jgi:copper resistance protein B
MKVRRAALASGAASFLLSLDFCFAQVSSADTDNAAPFGPPVDDERVYVHGLLDQFEYRVGKGEDLLRWQGQGWVGTDRDRLWLKSEGFLAPGGKARDAMHEALYDRPFSTYFDIQAGLRYDADSDPSRAWAALGIQGVAPQWFNVEATVYVSDAGHLAARCRTSYDLLLTQHLILQPELEFNAYSKADPPRGVDAGFSEFEAAMRLRYEIARKFAPYMGVNYQTDRQWGFVVGIRSWF